MRIGLFSKIFGAVLALVVVTDTLLVGHMLREQTVRLKERIVNHQRTEARADLRDGPFFSRRPAGADRQHRADAL